MNKEFFIGRYRELGWEFSEVSVKQSIRANTLKISRKELQQRLADKGIVTSEIPFTKSGLFIEKSGFSVGATPEYLLGLYYIQEAASQTTAELLKPAEGEMVLDCCAAPGGKTTHLSQIMKNEGIVIALDKKSTRMIALKNNVERMGVKNIIAFSMDAINVKDLNLKFDKILLDAPCSGNFRQDHDWFDKRDMDGIKSNAENQKKLLEACYGVLRERGKIVYSTCSLEPEENEENVKWFEENFNIKCVSQQRFWPSESNQGFFTAKFIKK